jgi:hypothetical protein
MECMVDSGSIVYDALDGILIVFYIPEGIFLYLLINVGCERAYLSNLFRL